MKMAKPGNCCTFIYTSGTTGPPKAVMISHDSYTWTADAIGRSYQKVFESNRGKGRILSLLPLSHVASQLIDLVLCIRYGFNLFFFPWFVYFGFVYRLFHFFCFSDTAFKDLFFFFSCFADFAFSDLLPFFFFFAK